MAVRFPAFAGLWLRLMARLPPSSRLRQRLMLRGILGAFHALNRQDFEVVLLTYHPEVEVRQAPTGGDEGELGFRPTYRGREGVLEFQRDWLGDWAEIRYEPTDLIDLGNRFLVLMEMTARGEASGATVTERVAALATFNENGRIIREQRYFDQAQALRDAGL